MNFLPRADGALQSAAPPVTMVQVEAAVGIEQVARAIGRCTLCEEKTACGTRACPNDPLLSRVR